jgi:hypothetical protein
MKALTLLFILSLSTLTTAFAQNENETLRCSGTNQESRVIKDLFFYDGETIVMIGGGTENMYVPMVKVSGKNKTFENKQYSIFISEKSVVTVDVKGISHEVYNNVRCDSTGE